MNVTIKELSIEDALAINHLSYQLGYSINLEETKIQIKKILELKDHIALVAMNKNKIIGWYVGGLNYQVEHHLFPRISHIHYPALSEIVQQECKKFGLPYHSFPSMGKAIVSHVKIMKQLGNPEMAKTA